MPDPMRIRASSAGDKTTVKILMSHEMETGQRKGPDGQLVPAWYIRTVTVSLNDKPVVSANWGPAVSKNPFLQLQLEGANKGDKITVTWVDTRGETRTDEAKVS